VIFAVYRYFRDPQVTDDKRASLLAQQVQWEKELTEKRFTEMGIRIDTALTLAQNHTHTVDVKVDGLTAMVNAMNLNLTNKITELSAIINERIPKK
jgi:Fe2+ transport system protein FeoA